MKKKERQTPFVFFCATTPKTMHCVFFVAHQSQSSTFSCNALATTAGLAAVVGAAVVGAVIVGAAATASWLRA